MRASRRQLLAGLGAVTLAGGLNGCRREPGPGPVGPATLSSVATTAQNPFGVPSGSRVELWVDDQFSPSWLDGLDTAAGRSTPSLQLRATSTAELAGQLTSRFRADAVPPGLVLNTGPDELGLGQLGSQLADLAPVLAARVDQRTLRESLRPGTVQTDADGRVRGLAATWQVHGLWYSRALFRQHGWHPPTTCEELLSLGAAARTQGKYLFTWGRDVATWFQRLAISAATRQHGTSLLARLEQLQGDGWAQEGVQDALHCLRSCVQEGFVKPGGSSRPWEQAVRAWSQDSEVLLVPAAGALLARLDLADGFDLGLVPDPALGPSAAMPATALHAGPGDPWILPGRCEDPAAAREMLRQLFSRSWATRYSAVNQLVSVVRDAVPADPRPGLAAQLEALAAAGQQVYSWRFTHCYGTNHDHQALWNAFLEGDVDVATLTRESQRISDLVRADASQRKLPS